MQNKVLLMLLVEKKLPFLIAIKTLPTQNLIFVSINFLYLQFFNDIPTSN
jgi:hypothetical protein